MPSRHHLDAMFHPESVAVIGASANPVGWGGKSFLERLIRLEFSGRLYPVNPKVTEIQGLPAFPDVKSLPEPPDLVIVAIPAPGVPQVLEDCLAKGVKNVHIFSSGFSETGEPDGRRLDKEITEIIQRGNLRVIGPNCMGLYVPKSRFAYWGAEPKGSGSLAFLSQSGGHAEMLSQYAQDLGVYFSKMISFGNARGLQAADLLEYLAQDADTKIIAIYLEGISHGNRFTQLVKRVNRTKPVIVWKGGLTEAGSRAVASHTGALAGGSRIWDAFFAQTGAVRVNSQEEIIDVVLAFMHLKPPRGRHVLMVGGGGGNSVAMADICNREGLDVPPLAEKNRAELNTFIPLAGNSARNPIDAFMIQENVNTFSRAMELAVTDPAIDMVILDRFIWGDQGMNSERRQQVQGLNDFIIDFAKNNGYGKPVVIAVNTRPNDPNAAASAAEFWRQSARAGVPTYASQASACLALARFLKYHQYQARNGDDS